MENLFGPAFDPSTGATVTLSDFFAREGNQPVLPTMASTGKQILHQLSAHEVGKPLTWTQQWAICDKLDLQVRDSLKKQCEGEQKKLSMMDSVSSYSSMLW